MNIDWHSIILSESWLSRLESQSLRRFGQAGLAEEAATHVLDALAQDDWSKCQKFTGKAKPETFLYTLTNNLLEEFSRKRFGRPRPPVWLKNEGVLWVSIWKMVCLERQLATSVVEHLSSSGKRQCNFIEAIIRTIKAKLPWCGSSNREIPSSMLCGYDNDGNEISAEDLLTGNETLEQRFDQSQLDESLSIASQLFASLSCPSNNSEDISKESIDLNYAKANNITIKSAQLDHLLAELKLTSEEQLLLNMAFQQGLKMNLIAKSLNMPSYQPGRLLRGILERIEVAMSKSGLPMTDIQSLLQASS